MAIAEKAIKDWKRILLDTTVIAGLFTSENTNSTDPVLVFTRKLIAFLNRQKSGDNKDRTFLVSTITLSELLVNETDSTKVKQIVNVLNSQNVEFVGFDVETAILFNNQLYPQLAKKALNDKAKDLDLIQNNLVMAREWITRDYMILMTGVRHNCDVVLTADKKTFYPLTKDAGMFCALTYPDLFEHTEQNILKYYADKADEFAK